MSCTDEFTSNLLSQMAESPDEIVLITGYLEQQDRYNYIVTPNGKPRWKGRSANVQR
ncbi:hypothetical protein [Paenibacillus amylolyticus]|uniref:hypothetical protein n=1 Tax=Paenibacillus amylolyticus TaxID=1451 RepID=UPI0039B0BE30